MNQIRVRAKQQLRKAIRIVKASYSPEELEAFSLSVLRKLEAHPRFVSAHTVLLYHSLPDEVNTHAFIDRWCAEKEILLPTVVGDDLVLHRYTGPDCLSPGSFGILEPSGEPFTDFDRIDLAVVPGMAFDSQGVRLGRGKGYYDRLLPRLPRAYRIGLCFPFQYFDSGVAYEEYDQRVNETLVDEEEAGVV